MPQSAAQPIANTIVEAAKRLGVGRTTIYELIDARQLRTFKIGTRTRIPEVELTRFVAERMGAAALSSSKEFRWVRVEAARPGGNIRFAI
jgi:excisionase family DNA binding protein